MDSPPEGRERNNANENDRVPIHEIQRADRAVK